ncbi:hypothetical protein AMTR_s00155p00082060 [Amborella trichopoda]|uniref:Uncharacterized protein n=1 Tax=Amborella trichopoda TaxID=13333 RepID=W1PJ11_AMBTC|nr:hypothetical protein AMTR_s00155p00082060 [Amborella trichopoda]
MRELQEKPPAPVAWENLCHQAQEGVRKPPPPTQFCTKKPPPPRRGKKTTSGPSAVQKVQIESLRRCQCHAKKKTYSPENLSRLSAVQKKTSLRLHGRGKNTTSDKDGARKPRGRMLLRGPLEIRNC